MGILIDTSVLIELERSAGASPPAALDLTDGNYYLSVVTLSELLVGTQRGRPERRAQRSGLAAKVLAGVTVLDIDRVVAEVHARLTATMLDRGRPTATHDLWIAATAIHHQLDVWTQDKHSFPYIPGVTLHVPPAG